MQVVKTTPESQKRNPPPLWYTGWVRMVLHCIFNNLVICIAPYYGEAPLQRRSDMGRV